MQRHLELISKELEGLLQHFNPSIDNLAAMDIETAPAIGCEDIEDAALNPFTNRITRVGIFSADICRSYEPHEFDELKEFFSNTTLDFTAHFAKFDWKVLVHHGLLNFDRAKELFKYDSNILATVHTTKPDFFYLQRYETTRTELNKGRKKGHGHRKAGAGSLKVLAPFFLGVDAFWESEDHDDAKYNLLDCLYTWFLTQHLIVEVEAIKGTRCSNDLVERSKLLMQAELEGIKLDVTETQKRLQETDKRLQELDEKIRTQWAPQFDLWRLLQQEALRDQYIEMCVANATKHGKDIEETWAKKYEGLYEKALAKADFSFNLNSPEQLKWLLKEQLGLDITDLKDEDEESTGKAVLEHLATTNPEIKTLLDFRKTKKLQTSFYPKLLEYAKYDGRIHSSFNITGARTGRLSSSSPNTQQQPKDLRDLFIAEAGNMLVDLDMAALEPLLIAYYTDDPVLKELINSGKSFHSYNAMVMFGLNCDVNDVAKLYKKERDAAKLAGLSILYGSGAKQLMFSLTGLGFKFGFDDCKQIVYKIRGTYPNVWKFKNELDKELEAGATLFNYLGRPIRFENKDDIYMKGFNGLIQGSGSDIVVQSAVDFCKANPWAKPRVLVHDSICVEVPEARAEEAKVLLDKAMTKWDIGDITFKTEGGYAKNWKI